ncbi:hypothetical protein CEUSTIGMA_g6486.t1 [Chlamydomonas eustigma]|uniref:Extradiol ring-cleavage dioxygenase class III enzyme subunit B domain-containing protein n=1 Tax=Chlamydomonas eustigma TaxID=1157962 RepID=A0A250X7L4_9CHLO|nr:hypothetical protein CEUSTIGMA_g6486.t1 [Chlamydomonas eustigma]|eukprot:GAX79046.1 hypothetical protein CEUSTIGMA_g6486.t1 [Chlamydomonas eustigma]
MSVASKMPTLFLSHGGGPLPLLGAQKDVADFFKKAPSLLPRPPTAILSVTAHWEEDQVTLGTCAAPPMLYDYYGFPPEAYQVKYNAPGPSSELVKRVKELLVAANIPVKEDSKRGFDHGTFVPLMLMFPEAKIPILQMSLVTGLDPEHHIKIGEALAALRDEGVFIMCSGSSFHNLGALIGRTGGSERDRVFQAGKVFDDWMLDTVVKKSGNVRKAELSKWANAPGAKESHPREEHLIPLMVAVGSGGLSAKGIHAHSCLSNETSGTPISSFLFE